MLEEQRKILESSKDFSEIVKEGLGGTPIETGLSAWEMLAQRRGGGGVNAPGGHKGQVLFLPYGPAMRVLLGAYDPVTKGGPNWFRLLCCDAKGFLTGISVNRLCESFAIEYATEDGELRQKDVTTDSPLIRYYIGGDDALATENLCNHLAGKPIVITDVMHERRVLIDGSTARGTRWAYREATPEECSVKFEDTLLWVLCNWHEAKKMLTEEQAAKMKDAMKNAGVDEAKLDEATKDEGTKNKR